MLSGAESRADVRCCQEHSRAEQGYNMLSGAEQSRCTMLPGAQQSRSVPRSLEDSRAEQVYTVLSGSE